MACSRAVHGEMHDRHRLLAVQGWRRLRRIRRTSEVVLRAMHSRSSGSRLAHGGTASEQVPRPRGRRMSALPRRQRRMPSVVQRRLRLRGRVLHAQRWRMHEGSGAGVGRRRKRQGQLRLGPGDGHPSSPVLHGNLCDRGHSYVQVERTWHEGGRRVRSCSSQCRTRRPRRVRAPLRHRLRLREPTPMRAVQRRGLQDRNRPQRRLLRCTGDASPVRRRRRWRRWRLKRVSSSRRRTARRIAKDREVLIDAL